MSEMQCPWCGEYVLQRFARWRRGATEYECPLCHRRHTRRPNDPAAYPFFPADIEACIVEDLPPLET